MNHDVDIVDQDPLKVFVSFVVVRMFITYFLHFVFYIFRDRPDLWLVTGFTNNKEISNGLIYFSQVERDDVFTLFFLYGSNDCFDDL